MEIVSYAIVLIIFTLLAIFGNVLVIITIAKNRRLKENMSNLFITNLAITDLINGMTVMLTTIVALIQDEWILGKICCDVQCGLNYCFIIVSMLTLSLISVDRYQAVKHALNYRIRVTRSRIKIALGITWMQGIAFALVPVVLNWAHYDYWEMVCAINWWNDEAATSILIYVVVAFIMCFTIPCIIIAHNYTVIILAAKKAYQPHIDKQTKTIKSIMVVMLLFFICMTPFCVTKLIKVISGSNNAVPVHINSISSVMQLMASSVNPFIYGMFRKDFRLGYASLLKLKINPTDRGDSSFRSQRDQELNRVSEKNNWHFERDKS